MRRVSKLPAAEADLIEIGLYIARDSPANAERFIDALEQECRKLAESPFDIGQRCESLHPELRRHAAAASGLSGQYLLSHRGGSRHRCAVLIKLLADLRSFPPQGGTTRPAPHDDAQV